MKGTVYVDRSGRLVIPKGVRDACGIDESTPLEVRRVGREVRLIPRNVVPRRTTMENGWIVFDTGVPHATDIHGVLEQEYEARLRRVTEG